SSLAQRKSLIDQLIDQPLAEVLAVYGGEQLIRLIGPCHHDFVTVIFLEESDCDPPSYQVRLEPDAGVIKRDRFQVFAQFVQRFFSPCRIARNGRLSPTVAFSGSIEPAPGPVALNDVGVEFMRELFGVSPRVELRRPVSNVN